MEIGVINWIVVTSCQVWRNKKMSSRADPVTAKKKGKTARMA